MNIVYLLLGSNLNERILMLRNARSEITSSAGKILRQSAVYESEPWGFQSAHPFLNQVIVVETEHSPQQLMGLIGDIEKRLGRTRHSGPGYVSRTIDIDILFFNDEVICEQDLIIPHPRIQDRKFTLIPLSELDGSFIHPGSGKTITEMISECRDTLNVYPYKEKIIE